MLAASVTAYPCNWGAWLVGRLRRLLQAAPTKPHLPALACAFPSCGRPWAAQLCALIASRVHADLPSPKAHTILAWFP